MFHEIFTLFIRFHHNQIFTILLDPFYTGDPTPLMMCHTVILSYGLVFSDGAGLEGSNECVKSDDGWGDGKSYFPMKGGVMFRFL